MDLLEDLIRHTSPCSECWVNTSGLNLTRENADRLKQAGATGVDISVNHYEPKMHNAFRGKVQAFNLSGFYISWKLPAENILSCRGI